MANLSRNDLRRVSQSVNTVENTPIGGRQIITPKNTRTATATEWAYNTTGYQLYPGYIVAITAYDPDNQRYTIARPTADDMPNIAVVLTPCDNDSTARVNLQFSGVSLLWYTGTAPTVSDTLGSTANSFYAKVGSSGFAPLETGSTFEGAGRCRARFFSSGSETPEIIDINYRFDIGDNTVVNPAWYAFNYSDESDFIEIEYPSWWKDNKAYEFLFYTEIGGCNISAIRPSSGGTSGGNVSKSIIIKFYNSSYNEIGNTISVRGATLGDIGYFNFDGTSKRIMNAVYSDSGGSSSTLMLKPTYFKIFSNAFVYVGASYWLKMSVRFFYMDVTSYKISPTDKFILPPLI